MVTSDAPHGSARKMTKKPPDPINPAMYRERERENENKKSRKLERQNERERERERERDQF